MTKEQALTVHANEIAIYLATIKARLDAINMMTPSEVTWGEVADASRLSEDLSNIHCYLSDIDY